MSYTYYTEKQDIRALCTIKQKFIWVKRGQMQAQSNVILLSTLTRYLLCILSKGLALTLYLNSICGVLYIKFNFYNSVRLSFFFK